MFKTKKEIKSWLDKYYIIGYTINDDLSIDVDRSVSLFDRCLTEIPVQFNKVNGYFNCSHNQLISLIGSPKIVKNSFSCYDNKLTSLKKSPKEVGGNVNCSNNKLISLKHLPEISGKLFCDTYLHKTKEYKIYSISKKLKQIA